MEPGEDNKQKTRGPDTKPRKKRQYKKQHPRQPKKKNKEPEIYNTCNFIIKILI